MIFTGLIIILLLIVIVLFAPVLAPHDPGSIDILKRFDSPSWDYPLGRDNLGRCLFSRLLYGARISVGTSVLVTLFIVTLGFIIGSISGFFGGKIDIFFMGIVDILLALPGMIMALVIAGLLGPGLKSVVIGLVSVWWVRYARLIRGFTLSVKEKDYVESARAAGSGNMRIIIFHILPQVFPTVLVLAALETGWVILAITGLSFLGLGVQPPVPEWGSMLNNARLFFSKSPLLVVSPGFAIFVTVLGFNLLGEGLRDMFQLREINKM